MKYQNKIKSLAPLLWRVLACLAPGERVRPMSQTSYNPSESFRGPEILSEEKVTTLKGSNIILLTLLFIFSLHPAKAQNTVLSLDEAVEEALAHHPGIQASLHEYNAAYEAIGKAREIPFPEVSVGLFTRPMERWVGNQVAEISVMQMIPLFGPQWVREEAAESNYRGKWLSLELRKREVEEEVRKAWLLLIQTEREIEFLETEVNLRKDLLAQTLSQYETADGGTSMVDVLNQKMDVKDVETRLLQARQERLAREQNLLRLLDGNRTEVKTNGQLPELTEGDVQLWAKTDSTANPMIRMLKEETEMQEALVRAEKRKGVPQLGVGATYMVFDERPGGESMMNGQNMLMPMIKFSLPIYRNQIRSSVREAREMAVAKKLNMEEGHRQIVSGRLEALTRLRQAQEAERLADEQLELVGQSLDIISESYQTGGASKVQWLEMKLRKLNYERYKFTSRVSQHEAVAILKSLRN